MAVCQGYMHNSSNSLQSKINMISQLSALILCFNAHIQDQPTVINSFYKLVKLIIYKFISFVYLKHICRSPTKIIGSFIWIAFSLPKFWWCVIHSTCKHKDIFKHKTPHIVTKSTRIHRIYSVHTYHKSTEATRLGFSFFMWTPPITPALSFKLCTISVPLCT